jgi:hypothetical protein
MSKEKIFKMAKYKKIIKLKIPFYYKIMKTPRILKSYVATPIFNVRKLFKGTVAPD